ncbi:MAG TPA: N-acetylmuramoyl-L-alanine amidase [Candidatus Acidoferrum sp.]|jgi:N-acetylmuramoyl-L-alanine amidase
MLLIVEKILAKILKLFRSRAFSLAAISSLPITIFGLALCANASFSGGHSTARGAQQQQTSPTQTPATSPAAPATPVHPGDPVQQSPAPVPRPGLNIVVLDPAHGGTDLGARGSGGIHESEIVLEFTAQIRRALELQGFQVIQTRQGNENPSFDDRSAVANAQRGAVFVTIHIASTGLPGTARVYVMNDLPPAIDATGLISWDRAQAPFLPLSHKFGDTVQGFLSQRFKGSPSNALTAAVRQLRTTATPAIAVEISSVVVENREDLDRMAAGVADCIALGATAFRPSYITFANPGDRP